ncbi:MAG: cation-translocating P-type ATPase [Chitinophagaceae bacterium]
MSPGLTTKEARTRLVRVGYNELPSARSKNIWKIVAEVMREPMFLLLISCASLYMILGDYREGIIMLITVCIIIMITFIQYRKTERALEALRNLASPRALVIRDGKEIRIPGRELVPGDLMILNEGDRVAADAELEDTGNLAVDESLLTGESVAVEKMTGDNKDAAKVFSGTMVVRGYGLARVTETGIHTRFGTIGLSLQGIGQQETRLQKEMKSLIRNLFLGGIIISILIVALYYMTRGNFMQSLLNGLAASMAILPEEFPVVLTVFLALGAWRLSRKNVLTRKPSAIETLGSATVLCSDKTGTITQNRMKVVELYDGNRFFSGAEGCEDPEQAARLLRAAHHASPDNSVDPMEIAITESHRYFNHRDSENMELVKEYPFSRESMSMSRVMRSGPGLANSVFAKGAPEKIFRLCRLSAEQKEKHLLAVKQMAEKGYRVLAVASASGVSEALPEDHSEFRFELDGLIGLTDPVRPEVPQAIRDCQAAGIKVIVITGDYPITARCIGKQIGLPESAKLMTGAELDKMSDEALQQEISKVSIFARVVPEQKLRIVSALRSNREIVAMTGDGVNDAPALKAADIGVAMGNKGTDVAREASALVLLDDNFTSIVSAIRLGRRIFDNLQKAMNYILAIHIPIIGLTLLPAFFPSLPVIMMPLHIIFLELIIDPVCSVAFETEKEEKNIMDRPPRPPQEKFFGLNRILGSIMSGFLLLGMVLFVYFLSRGEGHSDGEVRAITFSSLIIGNILLILTNLSKTRTVVEVIAEKNFVVLGLLTGATAMLAGVIFHPYLRDLFSFEYPGTGHFLPALGASLVMVSVLEIIKLVKRLKSPVK